MERKQTFLVYNIVQKKWYDERNLWYRLCLHQF